MKRAMLIVVLTMAFSAQSSAEQKDQPSQSGGDAEIQKGIDFFKSGNYQSATDAFSTAVGLMPNYPRAALLLANSYLSQGFIDNASQELERALLLSPDVTGEMQELKSIWRDYALFSERAREVGRAVGQHPADDRLRLLYGYCYKLAGYTNYSNTILSTIPAEGDAGKARAVVEASQSFSKPWVELSLPLIPDEIPGRMSSVSSRVNAAAKRFVTIGVGGGASVITGEIYHSNRSSLTTAGSTQFFVGAAIGNFDVQFNFSWYQLRGDMIVPVYNRITGLFNLYAVGAEGLWHPLRKAGTQGIDPYIRLGYSFLDLELNFDSSNQYGIYNSIAIGQGPLLGAGVAYQLSWSPLDLNLGVDVAYQVYIMRDSADRPVDGGGLNLEIKVGFKF